MKKRSSTFIGGGVHQHLFLFSKSSSAVHTDGRNAVTGAEETRSLVNVDLNASAVVNRPQRHGLMRNSPILQTQARLRDVQHVIVSRAQSSSELVLFSVPRFHSSYGIPNCLYVVEYLGFITADTWG